METLVFKNITGSLNYIEEEEVLYGKLEGIKESITFEGNSIADVKKAFYEAVNDYTRISEQADVLI